MPSFLNQLSRRATLALVLALIWSVQAFAGDESTRLPSPHAGGSGLAAPPSAAIVPPAAVQSPIVPPPTAPTAVTPPVAAQPAKDSAVTPATWTEATAAANAAGEQAGASHEVKNSDQMSVRWDNGILIESPHKDFRFRIGGRTQVDAIWLTDPNDVLAGAGGEDADAVDLRRARLRAEGRFYELYEFALEFDFVNSVLDNIGPGPAPPDPDIEGVPTPTDAWFEFREIPWIGHIRAGNFKEPLGLEHNTSSRFLDFLERSFNQDAFTGPFNNGFSLGVMGWNTLADGRIYMGAGIFKNNSNGFGFGVGDGEGAFSARITGLPVYDEPSDGRYLVHLGGNVSVRDPDEGTVRVRSRGSLRNGPGAVNPVLVDTGLVGADSQFILGPEAAVVYGPWLFQSEYLASALDSAVLPNGTPAGTVWVDGYYVEALWFLTGEHRHYEKDRGAFGRVVPFENAAFVRGADGGRHFLSGAWQLGLRYSRLDLRDGLLDGGEVHDVTLGVNWFFNPNLKLQCNYVLTHRLAPGGDPDGDYSGFGMRLAHDF